MGSGIGAKTSAGFGAEWPVCHRPLMWETAKGNQMLKMIVN